MDIRQIQSFSTIVREGSFSRAARKLYVGQPALSKQVQALERELGVELLERHKDGVRPTAAGARLEEMARTLLSYVQEIRSAVREAASSLTGPVRLGMSPSLVSTLAGHLERRITDEHPQARLEIVEALPMFLAEWVEEGRLDLGVFTREAGPPNPDLSVTVVGVDELLVVGAPGRLEGLGHRATADMLRSLPLVLTPGFRGLLCASPELGPVAEDVGSRIDSIHLVRDLVAREEYYSVLPHTFVRNDLDNGALEAMSFAPTLTRQLIAVTRTSHESSPAARTITAMVSARFAELAENRTYPQPSRTAHSDPAGR